MLKSFCGIPGSGKTLDTTRLALKHYKKDNRKIKKLLKYSLKFNFKEYKTHKDYCNTFPYGKINTVYTNYPVLLDKKRKIYSNCISLWDLNNDYSFEPGCLIIIDEVQLYVDSDEYKDKEVNKKLSKVAKFLQAHRHFNVDDIILVSQHPSRIFKKARNICESYLKHSRIINLPLLPYSIMLGRYYYNQEDYGKYVPRSREERKKISFDYKNFITIFNRKKVFNAYDSRYLSNYNFDKPLLNKGTYENLKIKKDDLLPLFDDE